MNKKRKLIVASALVVIVVSVLYIFVYNSFFRIDFGRYNYHMDVKSAASPDGMHQITLVILGEKDGLSGANGEIRLEKNDTCDEYARLWYKPIKNENGSVEWSDKNSKIIYYQKNSIGTEVQWIDNDNVKINGITLNIHKDTYDYRRK